MKKTSSKETQHVDKFIILRWKSFTIAISSQVDAYLLLKLLLVDFTTSVREVAAVNVQCVLID